MEEEFSFEDVYRQVTWELCVDAASKATANLEIFVYNDPGHSGVVKRTRTLEAAAARLIGVNNGGLSVHGSWTAAGIHGKPGVVDIQFSPTASETYIVRFVQETIRLQIAKQLHSLGTSPLDLPDSPD